MICDTISISESAILLSYGIICGAIVISKSVIILSYLRVFCLFRVICGMSMISAIVSVARRVGYFQLYKILNIYTYLGEDNLLKDSEDGKIYPEHCTNNFHIYTYISTSIFQIK